MECMIYPYTLIPLQWKYLSRSKMTHKHERKIPVEIHTKVVKYSMHGRISKVREF